MKTCIVVGGGIGGLSCALALRRVGVAATVLEKAPAFSPTAGAGFGFSVNGQACIRELGILNDDEPIGHPLRRHVIYDRNFEKVLVNTDYFTRLYQKYGLGMSGTLRADLVDRLKEPLEKNNALRYNTKVIGVNAGSASEQASVTTEDGEEHFADLVVGADGIKSEILRSVIGEKHEPIFSGECIFYGVIEDMDDVPSSFIGEPHHLVQSFAKHGEVVCFRCGPQGKTFVWAQTYQPKVAPPNVEEWSAGDDPMGELEERMEEWGLHENHPVRLLAERSDPKRLLHFPLFYRQTEEEWYRNRVCLLGDACHATLPYVGQGANMAIEDAFVLAQELERHAELESALKAYHAKRFKRTKAVVNMARNIGRIAHGGGPLRVLAIETAVPYIFKSNAILVRVVQEIVEHCPVPLPDLDPDLNVVR